MCNEHSLRLVCRLDAIADASDGESQLSRLSAHLSSRSADAAAALELAVLESAQSDVDGALTYLNDIQPVWSEFLEAHPHVGSRHGKRNAHGNPLNHHVLGVCHELTRLGTGELAQLVDILSPTRLALTASNLGLAGSPRQHPTASSSGHDDAHPTAFDGLGDELESVLEVSDLICAGAEDVGGGSIGGVGPLWALWEEIWAAQHVAGASEVYASCRSTRSSTSSSNSSSLSSNSDMSGDAESFAASDERAVRLAAALRQRFDDSAEWRACAAERRAEQAARDAAQRRASPSSVLGSAAKAFGLSDAEIADGGLDRASLKRRFQRLAFEVHPDVQGGSGERFLALRQAYKVLMRAAAG